jgi:hypothetical protein
MSYSSDRSSLINQLPLSVDFPREQEKFLQILTDLYKRIANTVNTKEGGLYTLQEFFNSQQFFGANAQTLRNAYRTTFDLVSLNSGNIAGGATVTFAHHITGYQFATMVYVSGTGIDGTGFTVVYPDASMNSTNISFTNPLASTALKSAIFVAEYLKN